MNLKRLHGIATVALITIAAALFAGCSNSMAGSVDSGSNARMATLSLSATGIPEEYAKEFDAYCKSVERQRLASRSILPNDPYDIGNIGVTPADGSENQSKNLVLVLTGKSETGMTYGPKVVTLKPAAATGVYDFDDTDGPITMESMSWNLVLTAYSDAEKTKSVLVGYCSVDLRNGSGTGTFVMGIAGLTTKGSVAISGTIVDESKVAKSYTMGIYRKDNGKDVGNTEQTVASFDVTDNDEFTFTANGKDVPPGTYLYTMIFYNDVSEIIGSFTDTIVINPGNKLTKENLKIDVIGKKPTEPEDLKAYLVKDSESSDGRTYNVKVTWTQADYATNYELNVVESPTDGNDFTTDTDGMITGGTIYGMASMDKAATKTVTDFPGSAVFGTDSSSMMYGDDSCVLKLETGKVYEIQLRARNYIGVSDWVDRKAGTDAAQGEAYLAPPAQRINRLLITYNTDGGKLKVDGNVYDVKYAEYKCWAGNDTLLKIKPTSENPTATDTTLTRGDAPTSAEFAAWLLEDGTGALDDDTIVTTREDKVTKYTYKNVSVVASFGNKVSGNISQEAKQEDLDRSHLSVLYGTVAGTADQTPTVTDGIYVVPKKLGDDSTKIEIKLARVGTTFNDSTSYVNVKAEVWGQSSSTHKSVSVNAQGQLEIKTATYPAGKMYVMVTADTKNATSVSQTLTFDLQ